MLKNTTDQYGWLAKVFHWVGGIGVIGIVAVGLYMTGLGKDDPSRMNLYNLHKSVGLTLLVFFSLRFLWRLLNTQPELPQDMLCWQRFAARANTLLLYALTFAMALSGFFMSLYGYGVPWFGLFTLQSPDKHEALSAVMHTVHVTIWYALIASFVLHVIGALYHHFVRKDDILRRML